MDVVPSILSSAQTLLTGGFSILNRAAAQLTSMNSDASAPSLTSPTRDPLLGGLIDLYSAREDVSLGVALLRYADPYDPTNNYSAQHPFDRYA